MSVHGELFVGNLEASKWRRGWLMLGSLFAGEIIAGMIFGRVVDLVLRWLACYNVIELVLLS